MKMNFGVRSYIVVLVFLTASVVAFGNGGSAPPALKHEQIPMTAICQDREDVKSTLKDAKVGKEKDLGRTLHATHGTAELSVTLDLVKSVEIVGEKPDKKGFIKCNVVFQKDDKKGAYQLQVKDGDESLVISGRGESDEKLTLKLTDCKLISFEPIKDATPKETPTEPKPVTKK